jgi:hypothetical protein
MTPSKQSFCAIACLALLAASPRARGEAASGNELALRYATATPEQKPVILREAQGKPFFFRYLRIVDLQKTETNGAARAQLRTVEPSSDLAIVFTVTKPDSLALIDTLQVGDALAVSGRLKGTGQAANPACLTLDPAVVRHKDRTAPKLRKELLYEVDPNARKGTDTSSGEVKVIK